eukprot:5571255-Pleurochrysis_carterae.AAC.1
MGAVVSTLRLRAAGRSRGDDRRRKQDWRRRRACGGVFFAARRQWSLCWRGAATAIVLRSSTSLYSACPQRGAQIFASCRRYSKSAFLRSATPSLHFGAIFGRCRHL